MTSPSAHREYPLTLKDRIKGCIYGQAIGDALGLGTEFMSQAEVRKYYPDGLERYDQIIQDAHRIRWNAANGGLMRTSIIATSPIIEEDEIANICRLTHPDMRCVGSCVLIVKLIQNLIFKDIQLDTSALKDIADRYDSRIREYVEMATNDNPAVLSVDDEAMGYTLKTMAVALWSLWHCSSFKDGLLSVVNLGGDADTNAAVACAILEAKYGFSNIPHYYVDNLLNKQIMEDIYINAIFDLNE